MNEIVNRLQQSVSVERTFAEYCACVAETVSIDQAGLAQLTPDGQQFEVIAQWERGRSPQGTVEERGNTAASPARRFDRAGTVGDFVLRKGEIFVGPTIDAVRSFPATSESLARNDFKSNYVAPLSDGTGRVVYLLSRQAGALAHESTAQIAGSLGHLVELLKTAFRMQALHDYEHALNLALADFLSEFSRARGRFPKLAEMEGAYLRHLSHTSRFRVEGILGGASLSGLKPSTLRYRLERLDTAKP